MVNARPVLSVLVLSEDRGKQSVPSLTALLKKMLQLVDDACQTQRIEFLPADEELRAALSGKAHAGSRSQAYRQRLLLAGKVADQLAKLEPEGFVAYHSDADRRWSQRTDGDFADFDKLRDVVADRLRSPRREPSRPDISDRIGGFLLLSAYWEIEAWLYQNIAEAERICQEYDGGRHVPMFRAWAQDPAVIDEIADPKDVCCLHDRYNQRLAERSFPAQAAHKAGTSFHATVARLRGCSALVQVLARTRDYR